MSSAKSEFSYRLTRPLRAICDRFDGFDYFVLSGATVNLLVIGYLIGFWLLGS